MTYDTQDIVRLKAMGIDPPDQIGLVQDFLGGWALFSWTNGDNPDAAVRYHRADLIEAQAAEIERLGRELNKAKYGDPDFSWEAQQAALDAAQAEIERLHLLLAEKAVDQKKGPGDEAEAS